MTAKELADRIEADVEASLTGGITLVEQCRRNKEAWDEAYRLGLQKEVDRILRANLMSELDKLPPTNMEYKTMTKITIHDAHHRISLALSRAVDRFLDDPDLAPLWENISQEFQGEARNGMRSFDELVDKLTGLADLYPEE